MIDPKDVEYSSYPSRLYGGQHVGTESGIKAEHLPSGTVAIVTIGRSQHRNREIALSMLEEAVTHPKFQ